MPRRDWSIEFYRDNRGRSPVEEFIKGLDRQTLSRVQRSVDLLEELGERLSMPLARRMAGYKFSELRVQASGNNVRVFYFFVTGRRIVLLHAFLKKSRHTPRRELEIAARRLAEMVGESA